MSATQSTTASAATAPDPARWKGWIPVIGLEVHCQLRTRTKLFCGCEYRFGAEPNTRTCAVCTAQPGALPVLNREALAYAIRAGLALGADIAPWSKFDRKNYFYCDLPKGYQISQFDRPFCTGGGITLESGHRIRLTRIHLEEDAGKAIHDRGAHTLVDLNRAGVPLIESVTEADVRSPEEAHEYLERLKEILLHAGVSDCDMEKGSLRVDVNVSIHRPGEGWRKRVELKNLNSFRNVAAAIEHEIARQIAIYESNDPSQQVVQETRLYDAQAGVTRSMRGKEEAHDYRYFPEPDLLPVQIDAAFLAEQREKLGESPTALRERYQRELGLSAYDAGVLTASPAVSRWFEECAKLCGSPKDAANWIQNEILRGLSNEQRPAAAIAELRVTPAGLAQLIGLVQKGTLNVPGGRQVLRAMLETGKDAAVLVRELGLEQVSDTGALEQWCREALVGKDKVIADVKAGKEKAIGALVGPVMKASKGAANPQVVTEILLRLVRELP
ncbi:MAG: Asp-tRNA(Asn)/Glu-tRNA(Gln) amidotransferase subunit GatB [Planctomycetes bacterium]|nr:Asp-tRNA(Asn)/Glu-tRNA(Gln) amidotransferase subunit GatB [Planctomycetota bacterium]